VGGGEDGWWWVVVARVRVRVVMGKQKGKPVLVVP